MEYATSTEMDRCIGCKINYLCVVSDSRAVETEGFKLKYPSCPRIVFVLFILFKVSDNCVDVYSDVVCVI